MSRAFRDSEVEKAFVEFEKEFGAIYRMLEMLECHMCDERAESLKRYANRDIYDAFHYGYALARQKYAPIPAFPYNLYPLWSLSPRYFPDGTCRLVTGEELAAEMRQEWKRIEGKY